MDTVLKFIGRFIAAFILVIIVSLIGYVMIGRWPQDYERFILGLIATTWVFE